jgi:hypothetical protein
VYRWDVSVVPLDALNYKNFFPLKFLKINELAWRHFNITTLMHCVKSDDL